jgi:hypothetical protein
MKSTTPIRWLVLLALVVSPAFPGQTQTPPPAGLNYQISAQDRDSIVWEATETFTNSAGFAQTHLHRVKQLETGMSYWDGTVWQPSSVALAISGSNIVGTQTPHQIVLGPTLTSNPLLDVTLPDASGQHLQTRLLGISFEDSVTKSNVFISVVTNAAAQLVLNPDGTPGNTVLYTNAFSGPVAATVEYVQRKDGIEQNVIFQSQLPDPARFSMTSSNVIVSVVSEILSGPAPRVSSVRIQRSPGVAQTAPGAFLSEDDRDDRIDFGSMAMTIGKGFPVPSADGNPVGAVARKLRVRKSLQVIAGMSVLFERLDYVDLQRELQGLPPANVVAILKEPPGLVRHFPKPPPPAAHAMPRQIARAPVGRGFVQDYAIVSSAPNLIFAGDSTYLLTGTVNASSTTTFEGGAVLKLVNTNNAGLVTLGDINCLTKPYYPCIITAASDNSVGEAISGAGALSGYYGNVALETDASNGRLQWLRFSHLSNCIEDYGSGTRLANSQFVNCDNGYDLENEYAELNNVLFTGLGGTALLGSNPTFTLYQVTMDSCAHFDYEPIYNGGTFCVTNSLLVNTPFYGGAFYYYTNFTEYVTNAPWNFQTAGDCSHYLPPYSPYHGLGSTNVPWRVAAAVQGGTTWAPVTVASNTVYTGGTVVFAPQVPRDGWGSGYDLGYHFPALDYLLLGPVFCTNTTVLLTNGVCLAASSPGSAVILGVHDGSALVSEGWPTNLNHLTFSTAVQEGCTNALLGYPVLLDTENAGTSLPSIRARFTDFTALANGYSIYATETYDGYSKCSSAFFQDCHFGSAVIADESTAPYTVFNSVLERTYFYVDGNSVVGLTNSYQRGGYMYLYAITTNVALLDNLFDSVTVYNLFTSSGPTLANNAYWNTPQLTPTNSNDILLTSAPAFVNGPLGPWYQQTNSPLLGKGSVAANAIGLYQYTSQFSQAKHGTNLTDLGFSYVACAPVTASPPYSAFDWLDNGLPGGAASSGNWSWSGSTNGTPDARDYWAVNSYGGLNQCYFDAATSTMYVAPDGTLYCYIYLTPGSLPTTIELQWNDVNGYWDHRAYWGADDIGWGVDGTVARRYMGPIPSTTGSWVELTVPASAVALEDCVVSGMAFTLYGGVANWADAGVLNPIWPTGLADTGGSGLPDYFTDRNGDGVFDTGDFSNWLAADSAYVGVTDYQEFLLGNNPLSSPLAALPTIRLGYWRFNTTNWQEEQGQLPLLATNVVNVPSTNFDGNALLATTSSGTNVALIYRDVEANENENINLREGTIRFYYRPNWYQAGNGGSGPGHWVRLLEVGHYTPGATYGLFALSIDPSGTNMYLQTQDSNGNSVTNVSFNISGMIIPTNGPFWYPILVGLGTDFSESYIYFGTNESGLGSGITIYPTNSVRAQGFSIGSSMDGTMPAEGLVDELETFNYLQLDGEYSEYLGLCAYSPPIGFDPPTSTGNILMEFYRGDFQMPGSQSYTVRTNNLSQTNWGILNSSFVGIETAITNLPPGIVYQVSLSNNASGGYYPPFPPGTMLSGVALPQVEYRGKVILLVDNTLTNTINPSVQQLQSDLEGDGWAVLRYDVARHDDLTWSNNTNNIALIKSIIVTNYNADQADTKSVFIVGHVAIPYSGSLGPDLHYCGGYDHQGAWPADTYYGDSDGLWTDTSVNYANCNWAANNNFPGDGKFDQDYIPYNSNGIAQLEMAVGRIDFANLPEMTNTVSTTPDQVETNLMVQYFAKEHSFRMKSTALANRGIYASSFGACGPADQSMLQCGSLNTCYLFGLVSTARAAGIEPFLQTNGQGYMFAVEGGDGSSDRIGNSISTDFTITNFVSPLPEPKLGFYVLDGSFFGDFNMTNDFLRGCLGAPNYGFASVWCGGSFVFVWDFQDCALGAPIGAAMLRTLNDTHQWDNPILGGGHREISIMGDPTLRLQITAPPTDLNAWNIAAGTELVAWAPAAETNAQYFVYRSESIHGPFTNRLNSVGLKANSFADTGAVGGASTYMVRTEVLFTTGSGSFTNLSQGVIITVNR